MTKEYTHSQLVIKARHWLWKHGYSVVITEMASGVSEEPDAIGFCTNHTTLIECKVSRPDFLNDKKKSHIRWKDGMGDKRYYFTPKGMIKIEELPEGWGLLEPHGQRIRVIKSSDYFANKNSHGEIGLLISALRRMKAISPKGISIKTYTQQTKCRATLSIAQSCEVIEKPVAKEKNDALP